MSGVPPTIPHPNRASDVRFSWFSFSAEGGTPFPAPPSGPVGAMSSAIGGGEAATALAGAVVLAVNAFIAGFPVDDPRLLFESAVDVVRANGRAAFAGCHAKFGPADSAARLSAPIIGPSCSRQFSAPPPAAAAPPPRRAAGAGGAVPPGDVAPRRPPAARGGGHPVFASSGAARRAVGAVTAAWPSRGGVLADNAAPPPLPRRHGMPRCCPRSLRGRIAFAVAVGFPRQASLMRHHRRR